MGRPKLTAIVGNRYGYLLVVGRSETDCRKYRCLCDCGKLVDNAKQNLINGSTKSCGCKQRELSSKSLTKHGGYKDGKNTPTYQSYISMMHRCFNSKRNSYSSYGGAGITVEEVDWIAPSPAGFLSFLKDMGERPDGTTLDRIDGKLGYSKENCRWASRKIQAINTNRIKTKSNTSIYRGVSLNSAGTFYVARINNEKGRCEHLGKFTTQYEAAIAYNDRAYELYGDDAKLNVIVRLLKE